MSTSESQPLRQFVRAGAGAGKTWNLTRQVVQRALVYKEKNEEWPRVVMTTFTRKATQELKERLLTYCLKEKPEALEFVQSSSFLMITTMHGLFDTFLRRYGYHMGVPSQYQIVDAIKADFWRKRVLKDLLIQNPQYSSLLSQYDVKRLLQVLKDYEDIYWYKDFKFAQVELMKRLCHELALDYSSNLQTLGRDAISYVEGEKWDAYWSYINDLRKILSGKDEWSELREKLAKNIGRVTKPRKSKNNPGLPTPLDEKLKKQIEQIKSLAIDPEYDEQNWERTSHFFSTFSDLGDDYMRRMYQLKIKESSLEANDLENFSLKLSNEKSDCVVSFANDWDMWFIDEFQDTSPKQIEIIDRFVGRKPCYIVGDPQQSIYLFRGSRSEVFFDKQESMALNGDQITQLQDNYRSQSHLLDFFNDFFPSEDPQFNTMNAKVEANNDGSSVLISHVEPNEDDIEIKHIMFQMSQLLDAGASPKDICVLARTNTNLDKMQKALMKSGFPVISHSSSNYYSRREIIDALSLLQLLMNPWDDVNLVTWMRSPWMALTDQQIIEIIGDQEEKYWVRFKDFFKDNEDYKPGQLLLKSMLEKNEWGLGWIFRKLIVALGFIEYTHKIDGTGRREANLWKFLNMIEKVSREPGQSLLKLVEEGSFTNSLEDVGQHTDASSPVEPDKINLMTVHASKGLQFKYVFIPFMNKKMRKTSHANFCSLEEQRLYSFRVPLGEHDQFIGTPVEKMYLKSISQREDEESMRVLYVGMTRAEDKLFLSWTGKSEKGSWSESIERYIERNKLIDSIEFSKVSEAQEVQFQNFEDSFDVPSPLKNQERMDISPGQERVKAQDVDEQADILQGQKIRWQGVVLHKLFENLKSHDLETVKSLAQLWLPYKHQEACDALDYVIDNKQVPLSEIIKEGSVEWGYQKSSDQGLVERRIDLWGICKDQLWIVDYKTGSSRYKEKAFIQMKEYSETLKEYLGWEKSVQLVAVYPFEKVIETISD